MPLKGEAKRAYNAWYYKACKDGTFVTKYGHGDNDWIANDDDALNEYRKMKVNLHAIVTSGIRYRLRESIINGVHLCQATRLSGVSILDLKEWIEFQFSDGMSRNGSSVAWDIDHVIPLACANFANDSDIKVVCNALNLRPLQKHENSRRPKRSWNHDEYTEQVRKWIEFCTMRLLNKSYWFVSTTFNGKQVTQVIG